MKRSVVLLVFGAACASPGVASQHPSTVIGSDSRGNLRLETGEAPSAVTDSVAAPPEVVFSSLRKVYGAMGIRVALENPASRQIGNTNFWKARRFLDRPMSDFVSCGNGMTGPRANEYRIYMSVVTRVIPTASGGSRLETTVAPVAQDVAGGATTDRIPCATTGRLEQAIRDSVTAALKAGVH